MGDREILEGIQEYFCIEELVDKQTFDRHGNRAWKFIDLRLLETLLIIRRELATGITINTWKWSGRFSERGLRTNVSNIVHKKTIEDKLYLSAHCMGKAVDFDVRGMGAQEVREWIQDHEDILPYKIRLEHKINKTGKPITWVHLDVYYEPGNRKVYLFNV